MTKQEYKHIRNLAWDLLLDARISKLPVDICQVASLYGLQCDKDTRYNQAISVARIILGIYGYDINNAEYLAIRILSPIIVLKELNVQSPEEISFFTELPIEIAKLRYKRYIALLERNAFGTSPIELKVLIQFIPWIHSINGD